MASKQELNTQLRTVIGTHGYMAPELVGMLPRRLRRDMQCNHTNAIDMWSFGCVVHEILTAQVPFLDTDSYSESLSGFGSGMLSCSGGFRTQINIDMDMISRFCCGKAVFPVEVLHRSQVSEYGIAFIKGLLTADPKSRTSARDALQSPWLLEEEINIDLIDYQGRLVSLKHGIGNLGEPHKNGSGD